MTNTEIEKLRKEITDGIDDFDTKYRFADKAESERIEKFIDSLEFSSLGKIKPTECGISEHKNMYLCFLFGTEELLRIYIYGGHDTFLTDPENRGFFSSSLLLIDEELSGFIYIDDNGAFNEGTIKI